MPDDQTQRMGEEVTERMGNDQTQRLHKGQAQGVGQDQTEALGLDQTQRVSSGQAWHVDEDQTQRMGAEQAEQADQTQRVGGEQTQWLPPDLTQPTPLDLTQPTPLDLTQPTPPDQTQPMPAELTQPMPADQTERMSGNPDVEETYVHFGPGVPMAPAPDRATAIWRGGTEGTGGLVGATGASGATTVRTPRAGGQRWILPLTVLILVVAVVAYFLFGRSTSAMSITGVSVRAATATVRCSGQETLTGAITTDGNAGTITYQWVRSDGTKSDVLHQNVNSGSKLSNVTLLWNFEGKGSLHATAVLDILGPGTARSASVSFDYSCSG